MNPDTSIHPEIALDQGGHTAKPRARALGLATAAGTVAGRLDYVDVFRGVLIAHMALDHASLMFNAGRGHEELAAVQPEPATNVMQFLARFTGVPVAPAFCFMAGFMVALTTFARSARGVTHAEVTRRLVIRGLVLIAVDAVVMGLPRLAMGFYSFMVLSSIGVSIILLALLRDLPSKYLLPGALAVLFLQPLVGMIDVSALPVALRAIVYEPVRTGAFRSMYPVLPWSAIVVFGFVMGRDAAGTERPPRVYFALSAISLCLFFAIRLSGGFGNAYPHSGILHEDFWTFAKYPPDLPFLTWSFAAIFAGLGTLRLLSRNGVPALLRPFTVFGKVPFFFYIVHFYVLGIVQGIAHHKVGLPGTFGIWIALLVFMAWPCAWYFEKKTNRPNFVTRYL